MNAAATAVALLLLTVPSFAAAAPATSAEGQRDAMSRIAHGHGVVLQVERGGALTYVAFSR